MADDQRNGDEAEARTQGSGRGNLLRGSVLGVEWQAVIGPERATLTIGRRPVHITADGIGSYITHEMVGRWRDLGELASTIIRYHPDYSPLARRRMV